MTLRNAKPLRFSPQGLSDALAEEDAFPGACAILSNLIPHPTTKNLWTPRPAATSLTTFGSFTVPTGLVVFKVVGGYVFGLQSTSRTPLYDEPFCYNLTTGLFVTVTGITGSNVPLTQSTSGDWTPPTMDVVGTNLYVTHPGFDGVTNFVGWFDITNLSAPVWHAGNMSLVSPLTTVTVSFPGSGYTPGTYTNVPLLGGTGSGAQATIVVGGGGSVSSVTVTKGGLGYNIGDVFTVNNALIGGGSGFVGTATGVTGSGIAALAIVGGGAGYTDGYYSNVALLDGTGTGATANFVIENGNVVNVTIDAAGSGYLVNDFVGTEGGVSTGTLAGGSGYTNGTYTGIPLQGGSGLNYTANLTVSGGAVSAITGVNHGFDYKVGDVLTVMGGQVTALAITNPGNNPGFTGIIGPFNVGASSGSGKGLIVTLVVTNGLVTSVAINNGGQNYAVNNTVYLKYGAILTITAVNAASPIGSGTGFSITLTGVTSSPFSGGSGFIGQVITQSNPGGFINFTTIPSWVRQFNGRAWFGINPPTGIPSVIFTDVYAFNCTNANQALSFGDNTPLTAAATLGLANLLGGVIQSLIIFKSLNGVIQVTGDATTNNLTVNQVPGGSGTLSPRSLVEHPQGLLYLDHDGWRMVTLDGNCTDPIGVAGQGVVVPFLKPTTPTRVAAGCNGSILRASVRNSATATWQEYWFDTVRKVWSGPHTFPSTMYDVYEGDFVTAAQSAPIPLWLSTVVPTASSVFIENSVQLSWEYQTTIVQDNMEMAQSELAELQVKTNVVAGISSITVEALENGSPINTAVFTYGSPTPLAAQRIDFNAPVTYNRGAIDVTGVSALGFQIGDIFGRIRALGYQTAVPN